MSISFAALSTPDRPPRAHEYAPQRPRCEMHSAAQYGGDCRASVASCRDPMLNDRPPALRLRNATKRYGDFTALDNVSIEIRRGEVFGLLAPNGAGKTTLISLAAGIARPTAGKVEVLGYDAVRDYRIP